MKKISYFLFFILLAVNIVAQNKPQMNVQTKTGNTSFNLEDITDITFSSSGTVFFYEDFNTDLSKWTAYEGTWAVNNGELHANYDISYGSVYNPQADLILNDQYQPTGDYKVSVKFKKATDPYYPSYTPITAQFSFWKSSSEKVSLDIGLGGDNLPQNLDSVIVSIQHWNGQWFNQIYKYVVFQWSMDIPHTAMIEKIGNVYKIYLDNIYLGEFIDTFLNGEGKVGLHTYGPKIYDDFTITQ